MDIGTWVRWSAVEGALTLQDDPSQPKGPNWDWVGAAAVIVIAAVCAVAILGADWQRTQVSGEFLPPESRRTMLIAPMPR